MYNTLILYLEDFVNPCPFRTVQRTQYLTGDAEQESNGSLFVLDESNYVFTKFSYPGDALSILYRLCVSCNFAGDFATTGHGITRVSTANSISRQ